MSCQIWIQDVQLQLESIQCAIQDPLQGSVTDCLRHAVGRDFENLLEKQLTEAGVSFMDEDAQRKAGQESFLVSFWCFSEIVKISI